MKDAWKVRLNEFDMAAIGADDNPIIPKEEVNAPVLEVIKWKKSHKNG